MLLRIVYHKTKNNPYPGPGTMFIFAGLLYLVAVASAVALPKDKANSRPYSGSDSIKSRDEYEPIIDDDDGESISQPLL